MTEKENVVQIASQISILKCAGEEGVSKCTCTHSRCLQVGRHMGRQEFRPDRMSSL